MSFKLLLSQVGFTCSTAADKLRFILSDSQCLREFNRDFLFFLFFVFCFFCVCVYVCVCVRVCVCVYVCVVFLLQNARKSANISKNVHFSSSLGRPMETSRRNTASRHHDNVHVYEK